ncbi:MAG: preprotein translocase subunit SecE [bacterium]|nr:preprotein translocase subunit SecE [bacterium]
MNRQMRRLVEREERRQKKQGKDARQRRADRAVPTRGRKRPGVERPPFHTRIGIFLREVRTELARVSWPTRRQLVNFTVVTLVTSVVLTLVIFGLDVALKQIVLYLLGGIQGG